MTVETKHARGARLVRYAGWVRYWACLVVIAGCGRLAFDPHAVDGDATTELDGSASTEDASAGTDCDPCALYPAPVDDDFDRGNEPLGAPWVATSSIFSIVGGELQIAGRGAAIHSGRLGGAEQWAQVVVTAPTLDQELGLVLRAQAADATADRITVAYHEETGNRHVHVESVVGNEVIDSTNHFVSLTPGTRLRAIARAGQVEVYFDEQHVVTFQPPSWPHGDAPGYVGVMGFYPGVPARVDDFGGGSCGCR